jgi:uncharacterized protein YukE
MTTLRMDVDAARSIQRDLVKLHDSIQRIIRSPNSTVSGLPPHWRSNSADQFYAEYQKSMGEISGVLSKLSEVASAISSEIDSYERMAERLSD